MTLEHDIKSMSNERRKAGKVENFPVSRDAFNK